MPPFLDLNLSEVFVDCGAFVGDTLEEYLFNHSGTFNKIFAFEPDAENFRALTARTRRLNEEWALKDGMITLVNAGVGRESSVKYIHKTNINLGSSLSDEGDEAVKVIAFDDYFVDQPVSFIKADIESYELDMLKGAEKIIRRDRPKIAVCIYHNASDMFRIQQWLDGLSLEYKFAVRHHSIRFCDETVLYAWQ